MITIFNRKELLSTYDVDKYANARDDLKNAGIEFRARSKFRNGATPVASKIYKGNGTIYYIFVKEQDYGRALSVIHSKGE